MAAIGYAVIAFIKYGVQSLVYSIGYIPKRTKLIFA